MSDWSFQYSRGRRGLDAIEHEWQALADADPCLAFYQCPAWARAYLEHLAPNPEDMIWVSAWRDRSLILVLPLERVGGELRLLHHDHMVLADILAPGIEDDIWPALRKWLGGADGLAGMCLHLPALSSDSVLSRWLEKHQSPLATVREMEGSAWLDCDRGYEEVLKSASANLRSNLTRSLKRAVQQGGLRYQCHAGVDALAAAMPHFLSIEASGWKGVQGGAVSCKPELVAFYTALSESLGGQGRCEIDLLWLGEKPIATIYWFRTGGVLHLQKIAYLEEFSGLGPGRIILSEALQRACADPGLRRVSFVTRCTWADGWRTQLNAVHEHFIHPDTLAGRIAHGLVTVKAGIKRGVRRLLDVFLKKSAGLGASPIFQVLDAECMQYL